MTRSVTHLVVTDNFAGVERYVATVAAETARRGWDVQVLGGRERQMRRDLPDTAPWAPAPTLGRALRELARRPVPDVLHVHMTAAEAVGALDLRQRTIVATRHFAATRGTRRWARVAGRVVARRLDAEIAISDTVRQAAVDARAVTVLNGVPSSDLPRSPERRVVVAQRLEAEKQTVDAVRAFATSGLAGRGWLLDVHGEGREHQALAAEADRLGLGAAVTVHGWTDDMPAVLARAGIVLATAPHEPYGLLVVEAMAGGVPVVATAAGGHLETVGRAPGARLYAPGDVDACARALVGLADLDRDAREDYGVELRLHQRDHLSVEAHVERLLRLYDAQLAR